MRSLRIFSAFAVISQSVISQFITLTYQLVSIYKSQTRSLSAVCGIRNGLVRELSERKMRAVEGGHGAMHAAVTE